MRVGGRILLSCCTQVGVVAMRFLVWLGLALALPFGARAAEAPPVVVELFTSQGCSSCPPADALLTEFARTRADVLPLAFHVTYWDYLGWKDPFGLTAATDRQKAYGRALGQDGVYTPEMVVDGTTGVVGSDRAAAGAAIARAAVKTVVLAVRRDGTGLVVSAGAGAGSGQILLVGYDPSHQTPVGRGENDGRTLLESNVVRSVVPIGAWSGGPVTLQAAVPAGERVAVLLQSATGRILGAARLENLGS
jgi:hypothetical protein